MKNLVKGLLFLLFLPLVSAQGFFGLEGYFGGSDLMMLALVFIIIFIFILAVLLKVGFFGDNKGVLVIISLVVSLISAKGIIDLGLLDSVLIPYEILGLVLITILPLLIVLFVVHKSNVSRMTRRMLWLLVGVGFIFMFGYRYSELSDDARNIYYAFFAIIAIVFLFDKPLHKMLEKKYKH